MRRHKEQAPVEFDPGDSGEIYQLDDSCQLRPRPARCERSKAWAMKTGESRYIGAQVTLVVGAAAIGPDGDYHGDNTCEFD